MVTRILAVCVLVCVGSVLILGISATADSEPVPTPLATLKSEDLVPCTNPGEAANFTTYSVGTKLGKHTNTEVLRRCDLPYPGEPVRANYVSYIYGSCEIGDGDEGCAPPLEVQTWPACERARGDYTVAGGAEYPSEAIGEIEGAPAEQFDAGLRAEVYTQDSTVVVFGDDAKLVREALDELQAEPRNQTLAPPASDVPAGELPAPNPDAEATQCAG